MENPICKICEREHDPSQPHIWEGRDFRVVQRKPKPTDTTESAGATRSRDEPEPIIPQVEVKEIKNLSKRYIPVKNWRIRNKDKYNSYMKTYMTERRKRKK